MLTNPVFRPRYQSDYLFLLVGTNPLPNYVAAELLLKQDGQLLFGSLCIDRKSR